MTDFELNDKLDHLKYGLDAIVYGEYLWTLPEEDRIATSVRHLESHLNYLRIESRRFWSGCPLPEIAGCFARLAEPDASGIFPIGGAEIMCHWFVHDRSQAIRLCQTFAMSSRTLFLSELMSCAIQNGLEEVLESLSTQGMNDDWIETRRLAEGVASHGAAGKLWAGFDLSQLRWLHYNIVPERLSQLTLGELRLKRYRRLQLHFSS